MGKDKLVDLDRNAMVKLNGIMYYPLNTSHIDECYGNEQILK
jgi:hypothetical protein